MAQSVHGYLAVYKYFWPVRVYTEKNFYEAAVKNLLKVVSCDALLDIFYKVHSEGGNTKRYEVIDCSLS